MITEVDYRKFGTVNTIARPKTRLFGPFAACIAMMLFLVAIATLGHPSGVDPSSSDAIDDRLTGP